MPLTEIFGYIIIQPQYPGLDFAKNRHLRYFFAACVISVAEKRLF